MCDPLPKTKKSEKKSSLLYRRVTGHKPTLCRFFKCVILHNPTEKKITDIFHFDPLHHKKIQKTGFDPHHHKKFKKTVLTHTITPDHEK